MNIAGIMNIEWKVQPNDNQKSLLEFLQDHLKDKSFSRRKVKGFIDAGYCFIQGKCERFSKTIVHTASHIWLRVPENMRAPLSIIYEDEAIIVLNKPDSTTCDERLEKALSGAHLVHRLDKDTTGVLVVAKSIAIRDELMEQFQKRSVKKKYAAIVEGKIAHRGSVENSLGPIARAGGRVKWGEVQNGRYAYTKWICSVQTAHYSFVTLMPETGKTHQLRVHLAGLGHPIIGDDLYGSRHAEKVPRYLLHAFELTFTHPVTHKIVSFQAPLPHDILEAGHSFFRRKLCIS